MKKKAAKAKAKSKAPRKAKAKKPVPSKTKAAKAKAKKSPSRRTPAKAGSTPKPGVIAPPKSVLVGYVEDYFAKIGVIALTLKAPLAVGRKIQVLGHTTNFEQPVDSMQIDHAAVEKARAKDSIGIKVIDRARCGDHVYLLK